MTGEPEEGEDEAGQKATAGGSLKRTGDEADEDGSLVPRKRALRRRCGVWRVVEVGQVRKKRPPDGDDCERVELIAACAVVEKGCG